MGIGSDALPTAFDTSPSSTADWDRQIAARKAAGVAAPGKDRPPFVAGLKRPDRALLVADELARRHVPSRMVEKILGGNVQRVFAKPWTAS